MKEFLPKEFVERERRRVFVPAASFPRRVVALIPPVHQSAAAVWDLVPGFARPMIVVMTAVLVGVLGMQLFYSEPPEVGILDAYVEPEPTPADEWISHDIELPRGDSLLLQISLVGD